MIWFYPDNIESGGKGGLLCNIKIRNSTSEWNEYFLCFRIFDRPGLNKANKLKISQVVGLIKGYILWKYYIDSLQIEVRTSFFVWHKFFRTFIKIRKIEIRNRLLWVRWYHGNSTFPSNWNAKMPSFAQYELIKPRERPAIWCISTFPWPWYYVYHSERLLRISILRKHPFSCDFNIVWGKPYHITRLRLPIFC
jgi:hypothetical protein